MILYELAQATAQSSVLDGPDKNFRMKTIFKQWKIFPSLAQTQQQFSLIRLNNKVWYTCINIYLLEAQGAF